MVTDLAEGGSAATHRPGSVRPDSGLGRILGRLVSNHTLGSMSLLTIHAPGWQVAKPGQFALLQPVRSSCFLGRAFSVSRQSGESVGFLVAPVGQGTRELCMLAEGSEVWILGPLGNSFDVPALMGGTGRTILVGGGVGIAPLPLLVEAMAQWVGDVGQAGVGATTPVLVLTGFRDAKQAGGDEIVKQAVEEASKSGLACTYEHTVEDLPSDKGRMVTDLLARHLKAGDRVAACGPDAMAIAVWQICSTLEGTRCWFSLEANMACGVGSCHGCVLETADGSYARVCREGPVFPGEEVFGG